MADAENIRWTRADLDRFKKTYDVEEAYGPDHVFKFNGHEFVVSYARYLIEYLGSQLQ